jgi:hypothetical protein
MERVIPADIRVLVYHQSAKASVEKTAGQARQKTRAALISTNPNELKARSELATLRR